MVIIRSTAHNKATAKCIPFKLSKERETQRAQFVDIKHNSFLLFSRSVVKIIESKVIANHVIHNRRNKSFATHVNHLFNEHRQNRWNWIFCERQKLSATWHEYFLIGESFRSNCVSTHHELHIRQNWHFALWEKRQLQKSPLCNSEDRQQCDQHSIQCWQIINWIQSFMSI